MENKEVKETMTMKTKIASAIILFIFGTIVIFIIVFKFTPPKPIEKRIEKNFNETFTIEELDITITDYAFKRFAYRGSYEADSNKVWLIVNATICNNSTETKNLRTLSKNTELTDNAFFIKDNKESKYNGSFLLNEVCIRAHEKIDPYETITGMFMYEVPITIAPELSGTSYSSSTCQNLNFEFRLIYENKKTITTISYAIKL